MLLIATANIEQSFSTGRVEARAASKHGQRRNTGSVEGDVMHLEGRAAVVAGGAGGLGSATVRRLVALGVGVVVLDPDRERAAALVTELGERAAAVAGDCGDDDAVTAAIAA